MPGILSIPTQCRRKVLSIAISYRDAQQYNKGRGDNPPILSSTHRDPKKLKTILKEWGYKDEEMTFLIDDGEHVVPTKENILKAIDEFVQDARPGDRFVFHYSGHGGQLPNHGNGAFEEDGMDEIFYPLDVIYDDKNDKALDNYIIDDEMRTRLVDRLPDGTHLMAIIDSCHSGTSMDLPYSYSKASEPLRTIWSPTKSPVDDDPVPMIERLLLRAENEVSEKTEEVVDSITRHPNRRLHDGNKYVTSWAACIDRDVEVESSMGGLLTSSLYKVLKKKSAKTHREVITAIADELVNTNLKVKKYFERAGHPEERPPFPKPVLSSLQKIEDILDEMFII